MIVSDSDSIDCFRCLSFAAEYPSLGPMTFNSIMHDEQLHVKFLRAALGSAAVAKPEINLDGLGIGYANVNQLIAVSRALEETGDTTQDMSAQVAWISSNATFALINSTGLASGIASGTTTISASYNGISGSASLTVSSATLVSISVTPSNPIVPPHTKIQMTAIGTFSDGTSVTISGVTWHTNTGCYATVSGTGVLRTKKATSQPVPVYATLSGITGSTTVTVTSMSIQSLQVTPAAPTIAAGTTQTFALIGTFSDGVTTVDLTKSARWQTSNYQDAYINNSGVATGVAAGSVTVSATYQGQSGTAATLTVSNATLQSINVTPAAPTIVVGALKQFAASGLFSDGSTQDITSISQWTSSTPTVAVVNSTGLASSATHGQTSVQATLRGVSGSTLLTVN